MKRIFITTLAVLATVCFFESTAFCQINLNKVGSTIRKAGRDVNKAVNKAGRDIDKSVPRFPLYNNESELKPVPQYNNPKPQMTTEQRRQMQMLTSGLQQQAPQKSEWQIQKEKRDQEQEEWLRKLREDVPQGPGLITRLIIDARERQQQEQQQYRRGNYREYQEVQYRDAPQRQRPQYRQTYRRR